MASSADHGFLDREFKSHHPPIINFLRLPHVDLEKYLPGIPRKQDRVDTPALCIRPLSAIPPIQGGEGVIRLTLGQAVD